MPKFVSDLDDEALGCLIQALTASGQAVSLYDSEDRLRFANKAYQSMFLGDFEGPFTFAEILRHGARHEIGVRVDDGDVEALIARTLPRRRASPRKSFVTDLVDGRWFWMDHTILPNGWVLTIGADITALKHNEKTLRQAHEAALLASRTDLLTNLPNRRYILELLSEALAAISHDETGLCVATIDIDNFKLINDTHGHLAGDFVLQHFSATCRSRLRQQDRLGRTGGEEFLLILPGITLKDAARAVGRLKECFPAARMKDSDLIVPYTFSAGLTEVLPQDSPSTVLYRADQALYAAKAEGRDCIRIAHPR